MRRVGAGKKTHGLVGRIEVLVRYVQRNREDRAGSPFESLLGIAFATDRDRAACSLWCALGVACEPARRRAAALVNVHRRLEHMVLRLGLFARRDLADI